MRTPQEEKAALDKALDAFMNDCRARLHDMADGGKRGWDGEYPCETLICEMVQDAHAVNRGDQYRLHDIANRAMFLWWRAWGQS